MAEAPAPAPVLSGAEQNRLANRVAAFGAENSQAYRGLAAEKKAIAQKAAENVSAGEGNDALVTLASEFKHVGDADTIIKKAVYNGIDADGKRIATPGTREAARANNLIKQKEVAIKLVSGDTLTPAETKIIHDALTRVISRNPQLLKAYGVPPAAAPTPALLDQLMRSGDYVAALTTDLNGAFDTAKTGLAEMNVIDDALHKITIDKITKQRQLDTAVNTKTRLDDASKDLTKFNTKTEAAYGGTKQAALTAAGARLNAGAGTTAETKTYLADMGKLKLMETQLTNGAVAANKLTQHNKAIIDLKTRIATVESNGNAQIKAAVGTIRTLNAEMNDIQDRIAQKADPARMAEVNSNVQQLTDELNMLTMKEQDKVVERQQITTDFEAGIMHAFTQAAAETIDKRIKTFKEAYPQYEQEAKTAMEAEIRQKLYDQVQTRWNKSRTVWKLFKPSVTETVIDFDKAKADLDSMLDLSPNKGVNAFIKTVLVDSCGGTSATPEQVAIINQMVKDPAFMQEQRNYILPRVLTAYSQGGGDISERQIRSIATTDWGAGALDAMFDKNKEIKQILDKNINSGYASRDILNKFGPLKLLMMFLMAIGAAPMGSLAGPKKG